MPNVAREDGEEVIIKRDAKEIVSERGVCPGQAISSWADAKLGRWGWDSETGFLPAELVAPVELQQKV